MTEELPCRGPRFTLDAAVASQSFRHRGKPGGVSEWCCCVSMSILRLTFLVVGPFVLVGVFYSLTLGRSVGDVAKETASVVTGAVLGNPVVPAQDAAVAQRRGLIPVRPSSLVRDVDLDEAKEVSAEPPPDLDHLCAEEAARLRLRLRDSHVVVRPPFILAGDLSERELESAHDKLIVPVSRALFTCYFDRRPDEPVTICLFSDDAAFQEAARKLDGKRRLDYYGYYRREDRRVMLNSSSGAGTLAHELTHALAHFDFPQMPEWLDEGLASLHEESEFSEDGRRITGHSNWRVNHLLLAMKRGKLRSISDLMTGPAVRPGLEAVDYAHARCLCLYLQKRQLLEPFYRKLRATEGRDTGGTATLEGLIEPDTLDDLDRDFRQWAAKLRPVSRRTEYETQRL